MLRRDFSCPMARVHSAKFSLDGVMENRTGLMIEPYSEDGGNAELMFDREHLERFMVAFDAARLQLHVHVIGEGAARVALDCIEAAIQADGLWSALHQLAHVQMIDPAYISRFRELGAPGTVGGDRHGGRKTRPMRYRATGVFPRRTPSPSSRSPGRREGDYPCFCPNSGSTSRAR